MIAAATVHIMSNQVDGPQTEVAGISPVQH
jgi:hypothetical protein